MLLTFKPFNTSYEFKFKDPDTGRAYEADNLPDLVKLIVAYRAQNNLAPIEYLNMVIENYLCRLPCNAGACVKRKDLKRGMLQYLKGGIALIQNILYNQCVSQKEADARAEVCIGCKLNQFPDKGAFVRWSDEMTLHTIGDKRAKRHEELGNCMGCTCLLKSKVWYQGEIKLSDEEFKVMSEANSNCWQVKAHGK